MLLAVSSKKKFLYNTLHQSKFYQNLFITWRINMKKVLCLFSILILVFNVNSIKAQDQFDVKLNIFPDLYAIDFAAFAVANNLGGAPRIIEIFMTPGIRVIVEGTIRWKDPESQVIGTLFTFETYPFISKTIYNDDIGNTDIRIKSSDAPGELAEDNLKKGKPTGTYYIQITVRDENRNFLDSDEAELNFLNPAQTLSIRTPEEGSVQNIGGVLAEWDEVTGASSYSIRANIRKNTNQSFEEALKSGNPLINDKNVGLVTSVNLRELLEREWLPGQEIVFQVSANVAGPGGDKPLYSNIINFRFEAANAEETESLNQSFTNLFQNFGDQGSSRIISLLQSGQIDFSDVTITSEDGQIMTIAEFQSLMNYLETNPDAVINIRYIEK